MNKSIIVDVNKKDKYLCWVVGKDKAVIVGGLTQDMAVESMRGFIRSMDYECNYGYYNACTTEIISRIIKMIGGF